MVLSSCRKKSGSEMFSFLGKKSMGMGKTLIFSLTWFQPCYLYINKRVLLLIDGWLLGPKLFFITTRTTRSVRGMIHVPVVVDFVKIDSISLVLLALLQEGSS